MSSAIDYCNADAIVAAAQAQFAELAGHHDPYEGICCIPPQQTDFDADPPQAKPRAEWCKYCRKYAKEVIDAGSARLSRRAARQRMRRTYKQIISRRRSVAEAILTLYNEKAIRRRFSASEIEHKLAGVFSDTEIRHDLSGIVGHHSATPIDRRFKKLEKYRYEILVPQK